MAKLVCRAGPDAGHEYPLDKDKLIFGRRSSCDVQIKDGMASREHFIIRAEGRLFTVSDLESRNGTKLNGRKITERQLEFGDVLSVGEVEWLLVKEEGDVGIKDLLTSKYEILEKIGEGGMGIVYKAIQRSMDRTVALKILAPKYAARPKFVNHFIEEARAAGRLNHPNIIQVHDVDTENGIHYFSMEYIDGATCMQLLRQRGPFPTAEALEIIRLTAKALQYAHEQRIIHRDVKPDNIMVAGSNVVKLADLGISKTFDEAAAEDTVKRIVGTPHYMAPEAAMGKKIDHRIDIYSLGATLYQLLTSRTLFNAASASELLKSHIKKSPTPLCEVNPTIPKEVGLLVDGMLAKSADDRVPDAQSVIEAIQDLQQKHGLQPELPSSGETRLLRQFAAGTEAEGLDTPPSKSDPTTLAANKTGGTTPRRSAYRTPAGGQTGGTTGGRSNESGSNLAAVKWLLALLFLGLLGALVYQMRDVIIEKYQELTGESKPDQHSSQPKQQQNPPPDEQSQHRPPPNHRPPPPPVDPVLKQQRRTLQDLESRFSKLEDEAELKAIRSELDDLSVALRDEEIQQDATLLRKRIDLRMQNMRLANESDMLRDLRREIDEHLNNKDFDGASTRLKAFALRKSDGVRDAVLTLEGRIEKERQALIENLKLKVKGREIKSDATGLRQLKADLPKSLLDDPIAETIQQAINRVDEKLYEEHSEIVADAREELLAWQFSAFDRTYDEWAERVHADSLRKQLTELHGLSQTLRAVPGRIDKALKGMSERPLYEGRLGLLQRPRLQGANKDGLVSAISGQESTTQWKDLKMDQWKQILTLTFKQAPKDIEGALVKCETIKQAN